MSAALVLSKSSNLPFPPLAHAGVGGISPHHGTGVVMNPEFKGYYQTFGQNVVLYRRRKRLTQAQLALLVGVDRSHISAVELGRVGVSLDLIFKLCNALDIAPQRLFDIGE